MAAVIIHQFALIKHKEIVVCLMHFKFAVGEAGVVTGAPHEVIEPQQSSNHEPKKNQKRAL